MVQTRCFPVKKYCAAALMTALLLLSACTPGAAAPGSQPSDGVLHIAATTWPVYCFTTAVTKELENVQVTPVLNVQTSCLHDYTLTVDDMKTLEGADVVVLNGAGLEDFMSDALGASSAQTIDASAGIELLTLPDGSTDPHIWMDPDRAAMMVQNIATGLSKLDPARADDFQNNADIALDTLAGLAAKGRDTLAELDCREMITFHDGFGYFADTFNLTILKAIEEEEGSEASAKDINEIVSLIQDHRLPAIFVEVNGSDATAQAIARETGVEVAQLSMIMSGSGSGLEPYVEAMSQNIGTVRTALGGMEEGN